MKKKIFKSLKRTFLIISALLALFIIAVAIFVNTQPQMGKKPHGQDLERISKSPNYGDQEFINLIETKMGSFGEMIATMPDFLFGEGGTPDEPLPVKFGENATPAIDSLCFVTWYGHSAFLIEIEGKRILIDPMLGEHSSPVSFATPRFPYQKPIPIEELTDIDAIILSHDHYDHLDYATIIKLKEETAHFFTALGVGSHLKHWGVDESQITELDWWQTTTLGEIEIIACPARHFSGRAFTDRNATQWASWVIKGKYQNLYFSGDGGYGPHFKEIGEKYGPFDLAMLECGQYNQAWAAIHMMPEQSVQAGFDVKARTIMPIHWGAFELSVHTWTDPIIRFKAESERLNANMIHPFIGERFNLGVDMPQTEWWNL
ncbi:MAG: MBL fold metallo-hydrolase [Bacteroidetes bacterium]|nr:MBL fold metallo-hydrolase [Bacteroidota bacterium]